MFSTIFCSKIRWLLPHNLLPNTSSSCGRAAVHRRGKSGKRKVGVGHCISCCQSKHSIVFCWTMRPGRRNHLRLPPESQWALAHETWDWCGFQRVQKERRQAQGRRMSCRVPYHWENIGIDAWFIVGLNLFFACQCVTKSHSLRRASC